jgi:hypothetical protein
LKGSVSFILILQLLFGLVATSCKKDEPVATQAADTSTECASAAAAQSSATEAFDLSGSQSTGCSLGNDTSEPTF